MRKILIFTAFFALFSLSTSLPTTPLTLDEKIGQMIVAATAIPEHNKEFMATEAYNLDPAYVTEMIRTYHIGGVIFLGKSTPAEQVALTNKFQDLSKHPLFIFLDAEWGLSMRMIENVITFPKAMTLGALAPEDMPLIYKCGLMIGTQLRALGIHSSLSPVCDINTNPQNPVINSRSFGEDPLLVAQKATAMMEGLYDGHTFPCAKHFPGHGNTSSDSHHVLPSITASKTALETMEFIPFRTLIKAGVPAIMMAHLDVPALTEQEGLPTSLSSKAIKVLRQEMGFEGLIITDALGMRGLTEGRDHHTLIRDALKAGNDILLCPVDVPQAVATIKQAVADSTISEEEIDMHVKRILRAKEKLAIERSVICDNNCLITREGALLKKQLYTAATTLARNENHRLPLRKSKTPIPLITIGTQKDTPFATTLPEQQAITSFFLPLTASPELCDELSTNVTEEPHIIIALHLTSRNGMIELLKDKSLPSYTTFINSLGKKATLVLFGNPYNLKYLSESGATIVAYENEREAQQAAAMTLVGKHTPRGQLPVTGSPEYPAGLSLQY